MELDKDDVLNVVRDVWSMTLGLGIAPGDQPAPGDDVRIVAASIQVTGPTEVALVLLCSADLARRLAAAMLCVEPEEAKVDDVQDAMGELANMLGGGVKGLLSESWQLSLPTVAEGIDFLLRVPNTHLIHELRLDCMDEALVVTILEKGKDDHGAFITAS